LPTLAAGMPGGSVCVAEAASLKDLLHSDIPKAGHDLKSVAKLAELAGPLFDTALAAYVLNPSKPGYGFEEVVLDQLAQPLAPAHGPDGAARQAAMVFALAEKLEKSLAADKALAKLLEEVEQPLMLVLAEMEKLG